MDMERIHTLHKVAENLKEGFYLSIDAGMDMHMHGPDFQEKVVELVKEGRITEERIDDSVKKILSAKFQLGLFEHPFVDIEESKKIISQKSHVALALESAQKSIVMLKNNDLLPLKPGNKNRILVTGPNANNQSITGDWTSYQPDDNVITVLEGIKMNAPADFTIDYVNSGEVIGEKAENNLNNAVEKAKSYDLVVIVVGENSMRYKWKDKTNGENKGRASIQLAGNQLELAKRINNSGIPILVIIVSGRPLGIPWISDNIPAILYAWEPGNMGGKAIGEIIFGKTNPSGKLPVSLARSVGQVQTFYNHKPSQYFHKYVFEKTGPLYPFGFGMSFTTFKYQDFEIYNSKINRDESTQVTVKVTNTGKMKGDEVVQLYIRDDYSSATRPVKELKGYKRITLDPGQSEIISFEIKPKMLSFYDAHMNYRVEPGNFTIMVGSSSNKNDLEEIKLSVL
jgi:beta-glucosidase